MIFSCAEQLLSTRFPVQRITGIHFNRIVARDSNQLIKKNHSASVYYARGLLSIDSNRLKIEDTLEMSFTHREETRKCPKWPINCKMSQAPCRMSCGNNVKPMLQKILTIQNIKHHQSAQTKYIIFFRCVLLLLLLFGVWRDIFQPNSIVNMAYAYNRSALRYKYIQFRTAFIAFR